MQRRIAQSHFACDVYLVAHPVSKQLVCTSESLLVQMGNCCRSSHPCAQMTTQVGRTRTNVFAPLFLQRNRQRFTKHSCEEVWPAPPQKYYGVSLLIRVDQLPSAERTPTPPGEPAHIPSRLSPLPPEKNGPPQVV